MCTATELDRSCFVTVTHCYYSYSFAVFLTEQSHSAKLLSFCDRHFFHFYIKSFKDILVYKCFDFELLLCCHCVEVREVKSKSVSVNELTCLMNVFTENFSQCSLKQMCTAMVSHNSITCLFVNSEVSLLTYSYLALFNNRLMSELACNDLLCVNDSALTAFCNDSTDITHLSAALCIEWRL